MLIMNNRIWVNDWYSGVYSHPLISNISSLQNLNQKEALSVYPNPMNMTCNSCSLSFNGLNADNISYNIVRSTGELVSEGVVIGNQMTFENLKSGVYFLKVIAANGTSATVKFIVL
jgi:hypothetical protein